MEEVNRPCPIVYVHPVVYLHACLHSCSAYSVLSGFTLALLEDSGWYQANYTVAERTVNGDAIPLLYGKGVCVWVWVCVWVCGFGYVRSSKDR